MASVQKELRIRQRVEGIYNKRESDFAERREYDDYLEEREDIIYNLVEGEDVEATEARIAAYQRENFESIIQNDARKAEETRARTQKAAAPSAASGAPAAPPAAASDAQPAAASYTASAPMPAATMPAQPAPCPAAGSSGGIIATEEDGGPDAEQHLAQASGWDPAFQKERLLQEAYSSIFLRPLQKSPQTVM